MSSLNIRPCASCGRVFGWVGVEGGKNLPPPIKHHHNNSKLISAKIFNDVLPNHAWISFKSSLCKTFSKAVFYLMLSLPRLMYDISAIWTYSYLGLQLRITNILLWIHWRTVLTRTTVQYNQSIPSGWSLPNAQTYNHLGNTKSSY
jgi:hypothetical protein